MRAVFVVAAVAALVPTGVASAAGRTVPKGTPYAAEVTALITGTAQVSRNTAGRTEAVCEAEPQLYAEQSTFSLRWRATFAHVTIPVAGREQLGRAYGRLHVPTKPTSGGKGGLAGAGWAIEGTAPTRNELCDAANYSESGRLDPAQDPPSATERTVTVDAGAGPRQRTVFGFRLGSFGSSTPAEVQGTPVTGLAFGAFKIFNAPPIDFLNNPPPSWNGVTLDLPPERFAALVHHSEVTIPLVDNGSGDCGSRTDPGVSTFTCSEEHEFAYKVVLRKKLLYRTVRAYPR